MHVGRTQVFPKTQHDKLTSDKKHLAKPTN